MAVVVASCVPPLRLGISSMAADTPFLVCALPVACKRSRSKSLMASSFSRCRASSCWRICSASNLWASSFSRIRTSSCSRMQRSSSVSSPSAPPSGGDGGGGGGLGTSPSSSLIRLTDGVSDGVRLGLCSSSSSSLLRFLSDEAGDETSSSVMTISSRPAAAASSLAWGEAASASGLDDETSALPAPFAVAACRAARSSFFFSCC